MGKGLAIAIAIPALIVVSCEIFMHTEEAGVERAKEWDKKIDAICKEKFEPNKAYKVFERVELPKNYFRESGKLEVFPGWPLPEGYKPAPHEPIRQRLVEREVLREKNPRVSWYATEIIRVTDMKVLGEEYMLIRAGSGANLDLGYINRHICPLDNSAANLMLDLFVNVSIKNVQFGSF